jgi:hypothetical protein
MQLNSPRRYYLYMRLTARLTQDPLEGTWRWKQESYPAAALPVGMPFGPQLAAAGYTTVADLDGADLPELTLHAGLSTREGEEVLQEFARLMLLEQLEALGP